MMHRLVVQGRSKGEFVVSHVLWLRLRALNRLMQSRHVSSVRLWYPYSETAYVPIPLRATPVRRRTKRHQLAFVYVETERVVSMILTALQLALGSKVAFLFDPLFHVILISAKPVDL